LTEEEKDDRIADVVQETLKKVEEHNQGSAYDEVHGKYAAEFALGNAADAGKLVNDLRRARPDVEVQSKTVVDHSPQRVGLPAAVSHQATVTENKIAPAVNGITWEPMAIESKSSKVSPIYANTIPPAGTAPRPIAVPVAAVVPTARIIAPVVAPMLSHVDSDPTQALDQDSLDLDAEGPASFAQRYRHWRY